MLHANNYAEKLLDTLNQQDYMMFQEVIQPAVTHAKRTGCGKQIMSIDKRMHKFDPPRNGSMSSATGGAMANGRDIRPTYAPHYATPPFPSSYTSAANTPPPLIADTPQSSIVPSINGDAVEGAMNKSRQGSDQSNDHTGIHR